VTAHGSPAHQPRRVGRGVRFTVLAALAIAAYAVLLWRVLIAAGALTAGGSVPSAVVDALTRFDDVGNAYLFQAIQQTVNALSIGAIYALIALGYTMVYGIIELINFAHGDIFMVGAFVSVIFLGGIMGQSGSVENLPLLAFLLIGALVFTMPIIGVLNVGIERLVYRPLRNAPRLAPLITAIGVSFILQNVALVIAGSGDRSAPQVFPLGWQIKFGQNADGTGGASISVLSIFIFALSMVLMLGLQAFITRTRLGRAMRATAQDREAAALMGVDMNQTIALTFLLGGMLAAAAGVVWGLRFGYVRQDLGFNAGLKAFTSAVLGGIGNVSGAVLGGFVIGFIENFASSISQSRWSEFLVFMVLTFVLIFKPSGLFGQATGDRA
jgi:branched-chain amino acid transport system permease protein